MNFENLRKSMVERQLKARGIEDERVLAAFLKIPRHEFVGAGMISAAYEDCPLPIGGGQTISQPYMAALMTQLLKLKGGEKVLEIGTGSGYQTAVLAELAGEVYTVERIPRLSEQARACLGRLEYANVHFSAGDGSVGLAEHAPYDAIIVTAAAPEVPQALVKQLSEGGRMVIPVGGTHTQTLLFLEKNQGRIITQEMGGCVFVPLLGRQAWPESKI